MGLSPQKKEIDGFTFTISQLPGMRGLKVFARLGKMLGRGGIGGLLSKGADQGAALMNLLGGIDEDDIAFIAKELFQPAVYADPEGQGGNVADRFDVLFQGRIDLLFKALFFALQVNYGGFLKGLVVDAAQAAAAKASSSNSLPDSKTSGPAGA